MYVCHGDDSDKGGPYFVVGGLTALINDWVALEADWRTALDALPRLDYFKFTEAFNRSGQFGKSRFTTPQRNARVKRFIRIINKHCQFGDAAICDVSEHKEFFGGRFSATVDQPFVATYTQIMVTTAGYLSDQGSKAKVDFIFDEMDETTLLEVRRAHTMITWHNWRTRDIADNMGEPPITRDDRKFIALQAADLLAGLVRQKYEDQKRRTVSIARKWLKEFRIPVQSQKKDKTDLAVIREGTVKMVQDLKLGYETGKARSKRLSPLRIKKGVRK